GVVDFETMTDLSKDLRARLAADFEVLTPKVVSDLRSVDGTRKFVLELAVATGMLDHPFNIVLMGMGEPLHNYDETMKALRMLHDEHGLAVSPRRVTLSTVGIVPALQRLAHEPLMPNLAVSLQ